MINNEKIGELLKAPLTLLTIKDKEVINQINNLIPYSTGFEIECNKQNTYDIKNFESIPDIVHIQVDNGEQRYRIPNGIKGIICLHNICYQLRLNSELNYGSGIHYHIDCTDAKKLHTDNKALDTNAGWILPELDKWGFRGLQSRGIGSTGRWIRTSYHNTLEFRIGNMSFDYNVLLKNIVSANTIVRRLKDQLNVPPPKFEEPDAQKLITYYKSLSIKTNHYEAKINKLKEDMDKLNKKDNVQEDELEQFKVKQRNRLNIIKPSK